MLLPCIKLVAIRYSQTGGDNRTMSGHNILGGNVGPAATRYINARSRLTAGVELLGLAWGFTVVHIC